MIAQLKEKKTFIQRLEERWEIKGWRQILTIIVVFGITGSLSVKVSKPILNFFHINQHTLNAFIFWPLRILIVFPIYQILLITIGTLFGQHKFFWKMEKKMLGRFIPSNSIVTKQKDYINMPTNNNLSNVTVAPFGKTGQGAEVTAYILRNKNNLEMRVINYGGIITHIFTPDKNNNFSDIVLGFDTMEEYLKGTSYFGAIIGRYGNRIAKGEFSIDGKKYNLEKNNIGNHLHGGKKGFDKVFWSVKEIVFKNDKALSLTYLSKDMEEGYPGNLNVEVIYYLTPSNDLEIYYSATTDKKTIINLTQHTYFNLSGNPNNSILDHEVVINADTFLPVDKTLIPTREFAKVKDTPFDFTISRKVKDRINENNEQLQFAGGYDHCWVLNRNTLEPSFAASATDPVSGRKLEVYTTEPGIQFYSGNFLDGVAGKKGINYGHRTGFCFETEHFPDSPNVPAFPTVLLNPGEKYSTTTIYKFR